MSTAVRRSRLLERERDLDVLRRALFEEGVVVVRGVAGIGKSALLAALSREAASRGFCVLEAAGTELERELAFGVARQLLDGPVRALPEPARHNLLRGAAALAAPVLLAPDPSPPRPEAVHAAMHGLYWLTAELAARRPLLLVVDDAHWADRASLRWLAYLGRRLDGLAARLVIAHRDAEPGADHSLLERVAADTQANVLRPQPLSDSAIADLLAATYSAPPAAAFVRACRSATGGNPLLLRELIASLSADGIQPDEAAAHAVETIAPQGIAHAVLLRLAPLGADAVAVAEATAVLSSDARLDRVAALARLPLERTVELADQLSAAGVLAAGTEPRFQDPILRSAVYEQIPALRRGLAHLRAAGLLRADGEGAERAASHLLLAPPSARQDTVTTLRTAAAAAVARGAPETAVALLCRALAEPPADRAAALYELALAEAATRDPAAARHAMEAANQSADDALAVRSVLVAAHSLTQQRRFEDSTAALAALDARLEAVDTELRRIACAQKILLPAWHQGIRHFDRELTALDVDRLTGDTAGELTLLALRLLELCVTGRRPHQEPLQMARRLRARLDPETADDITSLMVGRSFALCDALDEAREFLTETMQVARTRGEVFRLTGAGSMLAEVEYRAGRLAEAEVIANEALDTAPEAGADLNLPASLTFLVETLLDREPADAALTLLARHGFATDDLPEGYTTYMVRYARGKARATAGLLEAAESDLRRRRDVFVRWGDVNPSTTPWRSTLTLVLKNLGRLDEARAVAAEELELAQRFGTGRAIGIALRSRALLASGSERVEVLSEAERILAAGPARLEHARVLVDLGTALRHAGRRRDAREVLSHGLDGAARCGARQLVARARAELTAAGARPRRERLSGPDALTPSERRVAELAARGLSNREIAQALFITTKTVEMHLGRAYPKLGVTRRAQLAQTLVGAPDH